MEAKLSFKSVTNSTKLDFYDGYAVVSKFKTSLFGNKEKETWSARIPYGSVAQIVHEEYMDKKEFSSRLYGFVDITFSLKGYVAGINATTFTLTFDVLYTKINGAGVANDGEEGCVAVGKKLDEIARSIG